MGSSSPSRGENLKKLKPPPLFSLGSISIPDIYPKQPGCPWVKSQPGAIPPLQFQLVRRIATTTRLQTALDQLHAADLEKKNGDYHGYSTNPPRATYPPQIHKGLIAGLIKGKQWVFISPDHKAGYFWGGTLGGGIFFCIIWVVPPPRMQSSPQGL